MKSKFDKEYMFDDLPSGPKREKRERFDWPHGMVYSSHTGKKLAALYIFLWLSPPAISAVLYHFGFYGDTFNDDSPFGRFVWVAIMYPISGLGFIAACGLLLFLLGLVLWSISEWFCSLGYVSADELKKDEEKIVVVFYPYYKEKYNVIVRKTSEEEGGGFLASICDHPKCSASGETRNEAIDGLKWAVIDSKRKNPLKRLQDHAKNRLSEGEINEIEKDAQEEYKGLKE